MAAFAPRPPISGPLPSEFASSSPPDQAFYPVRHASQEVTPTLPVTGTHPLHNRPAADFKANGPAVNGNGGMPANGLHYHVPNGGSRHRGTVSMGAFDGPRSPPNTKSTWHRRSWAHSQGAEAHLPICRYLTCPLQVLQIGPMSGREGMPVLTFH